MLMLNLNVSVSSITKEWIKNRELYLKSKKNFRPTTDQRRLRCAKYKQLLKLKVKNEEENNAVLYKCDMLKNKLKK